MDSVNFAKWGTLFKNLLYSFKHELTMKLSGLRLVLSVLVGGREKGPRALLLPVFGEGSSEALMKCCSQVHGLATELTVGMCKC
eukprot:1157458-Pelagomonas_calceolata.AAC.1